jgi:hypothetical protein
MIHDVPRGGSDGADMTLTEAPLELDSQLTDYFRTKIASSIELAAVDVVVDPLKDSTVSLAVYSILDDPDSLPEQSRIIASRLHKVQKGVNPAGLVVVIYGHVNDSAAVSILKLEREEGIRFQVQEREGQITVDLEFLRDLTLTKKTRVFKTSLFYVRPGATKLAGLVSDEQRGIIQGRGVAEFFLSTFLGMRLALSSARATLGFVTATEEFLNTAVKDPQTKVDYQIALLATLQNQHNQITPGQFAHEHLRDEHRQPFLGIAAKHELEADVSFVKDVSLTSIKGFRMLFENGMTLVGSAEDLAQRVRINEAPGAPAVEVYDRIKYLRNR